MNKKEALIVLHEVLAVLKDSVLISSVSLDSYGPQMNKDSNDVGYIIRIKCDLDNYSQLCLNPILEKHNLALKADKGYVTIFPC